MSKKVPFSIEFFPPKTDVGVEKIRTVHQALSQLNPTYFSVTYGAGGSTRERTISTVVDLGKNTVVVPHLSCIGDSKQHILALLHQYQQMGIKHLVALRGDLPSGQIGLGELPYATDLVRFIREQTGDHFSIKVAAYPEMHPQSESYETDVQHFIDKANAGADSAITQFFFNADSYFHFVDKVRAKGCDIPITPGIMPINNASNLIRFADSSGAEIPRWIRKQLISYGDDSASIRQFGFDVVAKMCQKLIDGGAPSLHFYSMNQIEPNAGLIKALDLVP